MAANPTGEAQLGPLRLQFDRSVKLAFEGSSIRSDGGLLLHRELDDALGLTGMAADLLADPRTGKNGPTIWLHACGNRSSLAWQDMKTSMTPTDCAAVR